MSLDSIDADLILDYEIILCGGARHVHLEKNPASQEKYASWVYKEENWVIDVETHGSDIQLVKVGFVPGKGGLKKEGLAGLKIWQLGTLEPASWSIVSGVRLAGTFDIATTSESGSWLGSETSSISELYLIDNVDLNYNAKFEFRLGVYDSESKHIVSHDPRIYNPGTQPQPLMPSDGDVPERRYL